MQDITGMALVSYLIRVVKDVVARNPRFRRALGDVSAIAGNKVSFNNVQVIVRDIATGGERLSPDNFICTAIGRVILSKVADKDGLFIEWVTETDATGATPEPGVYYFNIDAIDEETQEVSLTVETYRWYQGKVHDAHGSKLVFADGIDPTTVVLTDGGTASGAGFGADTFGGGYFGGATPVTILQALRGGNYAYLETSASVVLASRYGRPLTPMLEYWTEREVSQVILPSTRFGSQQATLPDGMKVSAIVDQDGYALRPALDFSYTAPTEIVLSDWTPEGSTISAIGIVKLDPTIPGNAVHPENTFGFTLLPGETIATREMHVATQDGNNIQVTLAEDGHAYLPSPLPPGGWCRYDLRVLAGQSTVTAAKNAVNTWILPGLRIAIGDRVTEGDQCAILVSPRITETYRVYGGKPSIGFTLEVRANDPTTADEIAKALKRTLLHDRTEVLETDGLSLIEASTSFLTGVRDLSGTAPASSSALSFSGFADWRIFEPLVTRILDFTVVTTPSLGNYRGQLDPAPRYQSLGNNGFVADYS